MIGVIEPVTEPTEWVSSIVLVKKTNGNLRFCLDPRNLNKAILRSHFQFPTIHNIKSKLAGSTIFSSLDANSGFWTVPLDEESAKLCTFITPFGRFKFLRLPFGISSAPEIFHAIMMAHFGDIPNVIIYTDDILIYAKNKEDHDRALMAVMEKAKSLGIKFNENKTILYQKSIKFFGHVFDKDGQRVDEAKVSAIVNLPTPTCVPELQRFLGMLNFLGGFINNLSSLTKFEATS